MIKTIDIKNFRAYTAAKISDCRRINIVVGENGSGKTSLLEAIFLAAGGSVEIALRLRDLRGYDNRFVGAAGEAEEALWKDFFHNFNKSAPVTISLNGSEWRNRAMTLKFNDPHEAVQDFSKKSQKGDIATPPLVTFDWIGPKGRRVIVKPVIRDGKIQLPTAVPMPEETFFFAANYAYSSFEAAKRFSDISKKFGEHEITEKFRTHFPSISDISIELVAGNPMVCARVEGVPEKIPLNLISSGMNKLASIFFALASQRGSVALIDEVENGLHHRRLPAMWGSLLDFCRASGAQVFASTHSAECLKAAAAHAEKSPDDFMVIQTDSTGRVFQFGGERFVDAIKEHIELR